MAFAWHSKSILGSGSQLMASDQVKAQALHVKGYPYLKVQSILQEHLFVASPKSPLKLFSNLSLSPELWAAASRLQGQQKIVAPND